MDPHARDSEPPLMLHFDAAAPFGLGVLVCEVHTLASFGCSRVDSCSMFPSLCRDPTHALANLYNEGVASAGQLDWKVEGRPRFQRGWLLLLEARPSVMICIYYTFWGGGEGSMTSISV